MSQKDLIGEIFKRLSKRKRLIFIIGTVLAVLLFFDAKETSPLYTSNATIFPLNNSSDNSLVEGSLGSILGLSDGSKTFGSSDAAINIIELALSRHLREAVAAERLPGFGNKTVAELLIDEKNRQKSFFVKDIEFPADSVSQAELGAMLLGPVVEAKINKNGVLQLNFTSTNSELVEPISNTIITELSQFYIDLKIKKATADYQFTVNKMDSIQPILDQLDNNAVHLQNSTLFTPSDKLEYSLPKDNLSADRERITHEKNVLLNNMEEARWRLQKATPIIAVLDKPEPSAFDVKKPSAILYAIIGFILGCFLGLLIAIRRLLFRFAKSEIRNAIYGDVPDETVANASA